MCDQTPDTELNPQLTEILTEMKSLSKRLSQIEDKLLLVTDLDRYGKLQNLLTQGKLKEADAETTKVILEVVAKQRDNLTPEDMLKFPCNVLQVIDRIWKTYSQNRFGFSVQLQIYLDVGGNIDTLRAQNVEILEKFGDQVGWRQDNQWQGNTYEQWDFSLNAPVGSFPAMWWKSPYGLKMATYCFMRLLECELLSATT
jgi:hypothetical protein